MNQPIMSEEEEDIEEVYSEQNDQGRAHPAYSLEPQQSSRVRVSVRVDDASQDRFMVAVDLKSLQTIGQFIAQIRQLLHQPTVHLQNPEEYLVEDRADPGLILVLEPDIVVTDLDTIQNNDNLLITTKDNLVRI